MAWLGPHGRLGVDHWIPSVCGLGPAFKSPWYPDCFRKTITGSTMVVVVSIEDATGQCSMFRLEWSQCWFCPFAPLLCLIRTRSAQRYTENQFGLFKWNLLKHTHRHTNRSTRSQWRRYEAESKYIQNSIVICLQ